MWLFTQIGFFSVVAHRQNNKLIVRARQHADILRLSKKIKIGRITHSTNRDYPYRAMVEREEWAKFLSELATEMVATNFKDSIDPKDTARQRAYYDVWRTMQEAQGRMK